MLLSLSVKIQAYFFREKQHIFINEDKVVSTLHISIVFLYSLISVSVGKITMNMAHSLL